jgi:hypothetical protein
MQSIFSTKGMPVVQRYAIADKGHERGQLIEKMRVGTSRPPTGWGKRMVFPLCAIIFR